VNNHTETFDCSDITGVRYVKFLSTKAATQWSVKIYDFAVYGTLVTEVTDNEVPTITSAEAAADAATETSVTLNINGDNIVDVADVNLLIEIMLGRDSASNYTGADIDNNGIVDVADVNAVINIMLGK